MKLFNKKQKATVKKYAVIRTTSKGYSVEYRNARKVIHSGQF